MKFSGWRFCALVSLVSVAGLFFAQRAPHAQSPPAPARKTKIIIYPSANETIEQLKKQGIDKVDNYGSYWVAEASDQDVAKLKASHGARAVKANHLNRIELNAMAIDTTVGERPIPSHLRQGDETGKRLRLIQFKGPVQPEWLEQVKAAGDVKVAGYVPNNAYILYLDDLAEKKLDALKEPDGPIQWIGKYHPYYKLADTLQQSPSATVEVRITLLNGSRTDDAISAIGSFAFNGIQKRVSGRDQTRVMITTRPNDLAQIAQLPEVLWIEPVIRNVKMDEVQALIVAGFTNGPGHGPPSGESYLAFLSGKGFSSLPSTYPVMDIADTGLDLENPECQSPREPWHPSFYVFGASLAQAECCVAPNLPDTRVAYNTAGNDTDGHGTFVASVALGFDNLPDEFLNCFTRGTREQTNIAYRCVVGGVTNSVTGTNDCTDPICAGFTECLTTTSTVQVCAIVTNEPSDTFGFTANTRVLVRRFPPFFFSSYSGYQLGLGVSPFGRFGASLGGADQLDTPEAAASEISAAYLQTARISNNSWGEGLSIGGNDGLYNDVAQTYDALVRDAVGTGLTNTPNESPLNQEMIIVFAGGDGNGQLGAVGGFGDVLVTPPATAKNVISVGASEGVIGPSFPQLTGVFSTEGDNAEEIAIFNSFGPTRDGRFKPEIVAPGTFITGARSQATYDHPDCDGCNPNGPDPAVCSDSDDANERIVSTITDLYNAIQDPRTLFYGLGTKFGTSFSAPAVSGGAQLLWWWFQNKLSMLQPSPAMTKAYMLNSARYLSVTNPLTGTLDTLPSPAQGMGRLDLARMFDLVPRVLRDESTPRAIDTPLITTNPVPQQTFFSRPGQSYQLSGVVASNLLPFRVTLSWTDAPGDPAAFKALVNDLDLEVTIGGQTYRGNQFVGPSSVTGCPDPNRPCPDDINNTESVFLPAGASGVWTATVRAVNIAAAGVPNVHTGLGEDADLGQDFALVVYNSTTNAFGIAGAPSDVPNPATNDTCQTAITITNFPFTVTANNLTATDYTDNHPSPSAARGGIEEFFKIPKPALGTVFTVISSGANSLLSVWRGDCGGLVEVGSSASVPTTMNFTATGAGDYYLVFDGLNGGNATVTFTITNTLPTVAVFPSSIDFGDQATSTTSTPPSSVTIVNSGGVPLQILNVLLTGANPADFLITTNPCIGATIQASDSCSFDVRFRPTVVGTRTASLVITTSDPNTPTNTVSLTGNGVAPAPAVSLDTTRLIFGNQVINTTSSPPQSVIVSNSGASTLVVTNIAISGGDFILTNVTCLAASIPPGGICSIGVVFHPTTTGLHTSTLSVFSIAGSSPDTVDLSGNGIAPGIGLNSTSLSFGTQAVSIVSAPQTIIVQSIGDSSLAITNVVKIGANPNDFAVTANTCSNSLIPPGGSCGISLTFTPSALGNRTAQLQIFGEATNSPRVVNISGVGAAAAPSIQISPLSLTFGDQPSNSLSAIQSLTVSNAGNASLVVSTNLTFVGGNSADFIVTNNTCGGLPISQGGTCTIGVMFRPTGTGARSSNLQILSNSGNGTNSVPVTGFGTAPLMTLSPNPLNFNTQAVSIASAPQTVNVLGGGDSAFTVTNFALVGTNPGAFIVTNNTCLGNNIPPGDSCGFAISFRPTVLGSNTAQLVVFSTAINSPQTNTLTGVGTVTAPSVGVTPSSLSFGNQSVGTAGTNLSITVTNTGNATLAISSIVFSPAGEFFVTNNTCGSLPVGFSCTLQAFFKPSTTGARSSTLNITNNSGVNPVLVTASGSGVSPVITLSPTSLNFGTQAVSVVSAPQTIIVHSDGDAPLTITNVTMIGTDGADFSVTNNTCLNVPLPPGDSCGIGVTFRPSALGARTAQLLVWGTAINSPQTNNLSGFGATNVSSVIVSPLSLAFIDQGIGTTSAVQSVTVSNAGTAALIINSVAFSGGDTGDFLVVNNNCQGAPIPGGSSCTIGVASAPKQSGLLNTTLRILSNAGNGTNTVSVSSSGVAPIITLSTNVLDFGTNAVNTTSTPRTLFVANSGNAELVITGVTLSGVNPGDFQIVANSCLGVPILPAQNCQITLTFRTTTILPRSALLTITGNATNSPQVVTLSGVGAPFVCGTITLAPTNLPTAFKGQFYSQLITASGGTTQYTFQVTSGALPPVLTLNANGVLSGTPTTNGTFNFTVTASDANGCTGSQSYALSVSCPPITLSPASLPNGTTGIAYSQTITASGGVAPYSFAVPPADLPPGLTLTSGGVLSGTPTTFGSFTFTVTATDATGCTGSQAYTIVIGCQSLFLFPTTFPNAVVGTPYLQTNTVVGGLAPYTFTVSSGTLPPVLTYSSTGVLSGVPTTVGTFNFTITLTDVNGCSTSRAYTIVVGCGTMTLVPQTLPNGTLGTLYNQIVSISGRTGGVTFARTSGVLPPGLTLSSAGTITGTPTVKSDVVGFTFKITGTDAANGCIGERFYTVKIGCPTITLSPSPLPFGTVGTAYSQTLTASGGASPYTFAQTGGSLPSGMSLSSAGVLSGTPLSGSSIFTVTVTDSNGCPGAVTYTLILNDNCPAVTVSPGSLPNGTVGAAYSQTLTASGGVTPHKFAVFSGSLPPGLDLSIDGVLSGTLLATSTVNFTVVALDANGCAGFQPYSMNVVCDTIIVSPSALTTGIVGVAYSQTLLATGGLAPHSFTVTGGAVPAGLTLDSSGALTGTPTSAGTVAFTATATDAASCTGNRAYLLTIIPAADLAITKSDSPDPVIVGSNVTYTITITNLGPSTAVSVTVTDTLPSSVTFVSASSGCGESSGVVACGLGSLASGSSATITIVATAGTEGSLTNTATVSSGVTDLIANNNTGTATTVVSPVVAFSAVAQIVNAKAGAATLSVNRDGNSGAAVTVDYATSDDTALADTDYVPTSGVLSFAPGVKQRNVTVPVLASSVAGHKKLKLGLHNPTGGASLGARSTVTVDVITSAKASSPVVFNDSDGDVVTLKLAGAGSMEVSLLGSGGVGPVDQIRLLGADGTSTLTVTVKRGPAGNGQVDIGSIVADDSLKGINAKSANITGAGITLGGSLGKLKVKAIRSSLVSANAGIGTLNAEELSDTLVTAGFAPADAANPMGGGVFVNTALIKSVKVTRFEGSTIAAAQIGKVQLGEVNTANGGTVFGILARDAIGGVSLKNPKRKWKAAALTDQAVGDFHVKR